MKKLTYILPFLFMAGIVSAQEIKSVKRVSLSPLTNSSGENFSYDPEIDGSGRFVIFTSIADNFAAAGSSSGEYHEHGYIRDVLTGTTTQLDVTSTGTAGIPAKSFSPFSRTFGSSFDPHISRDGKYAVFISPSSNISPDGLNETFGSWVYLKNLENGEIKRIPLATSGSQTMVETPTYLAINADGSVVVIMSIVAELTDATCSNCKWELTVYDKNSNTTNIIDTGITGNKYNPGISDDGRYVVFENQVGDFSGPTYAYIYDRVLQQTTALNDAQISQSPAISGDGAYIAYTDLLNSTYGIKLRDRVSGIETLISGGFDGQFAAGISDFPSISQDGRFIAFLSSADNLVENDGNGLDDIFVYDRLKQKTTSVSVQSACAGVQTREQFNTGPPSISSDGKIIAFTVLERLISTDQKDSDGNIVQPADQNSFDDVYIAEIDYDASPAVFKKGVTPDSPFVSVDCKGSDARIQIQQLLKAAANNKAGLTAKKNPTGIKKLTQQVFIKKISENGKSTLVKKLNAKRNVLASAGLPPGNYSAELQAEARLNNGKTTKSKLSLPSNFTITN